jgi:dipeptidyl aminopeptidase/acylaminoacyl peptidase
MPAQTLPYGEWPSPISAADVARGALSLSFSSAVATPDGVEAWWLEGRPDSGGRYALMRRTTSGEVVEHLAPDWNVRSRIIEYGARPWLRTWSGLTGPATVFCFWDDQRLYLRGDGDQAPTPLTVAPTDSVTHMYGEPVPGPRASVIAVRETHTDGVVSRCLVQVPLDGSAAGDDSAVAVLNDQHHFYGHPRLSPDGTRVSYIAWDHPQMPWDGTVAAVVDITGELPVVERVLAGSTTESVLQPEWRDARHLYLVSDRAGWWNLYRCHVDGGALTPLLERDEEFAGPLWELGYTSYAQLGDGRLAVTHGRGHEALAVLDPDDGTLTEAPGELGWEPYLSAAGTTVVSVVTGGTAPTSVAMMDLGAVAPQVELVRSAVTSLPEPAYLPRPQRRSFTRPDGHPVHTVVYPPANPDAVAPDGELPPYLVVVHGGPTAHAIPRLSMMFAYFTSRGIGIIDVNYGGSTGYGRAYRERLKGQWGVIDVEDSVIAAQALAAAGEADPARLGIRGGSAGGWTTVSALVRTEAFGAGAAYYPVTDLLPFADDTHDFESRYLDGLIGPLPQARDRYVERSPLTHLGQLRTPILLLQGDDDKVVPPSQPKAVNDALDGSGIPHAYLVFEGEQHGFRKAESNIAALEAELSFYGQVFGFTPPGVPTLALSY